MVVQVLFLDRDNFGDDAEAVTRGRLPEHRPVPARLRLEVALLWDGFCRGRRSVGSVCHLRHVLLGWVGWWRVRVEIPSVTTAKPYGHISPSLTASPSRITQ